MRLPKIDGATPDKPSSSEAKSLSSSETKPLSLSAPKMLSPLVNQELGQEKLPQQHQSNLDSPQGSSVWVDGETLKRITGVAVAMTAGLSRPVAKAEALRQIVEFYCEKCEKWAA